MTAITIRDVPDDTVNALKVRAAQAGQSLQAYVLELLSRDAAKLTLAESFGVPSSPATPGSNAAERPAAGSRPSPRRPPDPNPDLHV
jgi:plasmid stability protein